MSKELFETIYNEIVARGGGDRSTKMTIVLKKDGCFIRTEIQYVIIYDEYVEITATQNCNRSYIPYENISHIVLE